MCLCLEFIWAFFTILPFITFSPCLGPTHSLHYFRLPLPANTNKSCFPPFSHLFDFNALFSSFLHSFHFKVILFACSPPPSLFSLSCDIPATNFTLKLRCIPYCEVSFKAPGAFLLLTQFASRFFLSLCELKCWLCVAHWMESDSNTVRVNISFHCLTNRNKSFPPVVLVSRVT